MIKIVKTFLIWRVLLFLSAFGAVLIIPQFGGQFPYYQQQLIKTGLPEWVWGFGNFDGVHYLRIAQDGYSSDFSQAFFPVYPLLIKYLSFLIQPFWAGLIISNLAFLLSLIVLYKLFLIDYDKKTVIKTLLVLMAFPTAFYFGAIYSESVFLFLASLSILMARQKKFIYAGILAGIASGTRLFGAFLFIIIFLEFINAYRSQNKINFKSLFELSLSLIFSVSGIIIYIFYLLYYFNNAFYFINAQPAFGAERSTTIVSLPQVYYRYFKILLTSQINSLKYFTAATEIAITSGILGLIIFKFRQIRFCYLLFSLVCLVTPTLTGTFSSMPRYCLSSFLIFPVIAKLPDKYFRMVLTIFIVLQIILVSLFVRGYWVS